MRSLVAVRCLNILPKSSLLARNNSKRQALGAKGGLPCSIACLPDSGCWAGPAQAQQSAAAGPDVKLGIVSFLTGPAAAPFGIPGRNAAEILIEALKVGFEGQSRRGQAMRLSVGAAGLGIVIGQGLLLPHWQGKGTGPTNK